MIQHDGRPPRGNCGQQALFTEDTANLFIQYQAHAFLEGNLPHDFLIPSRQGLYQTCASLALKWILQLPIDHCFSTPLPCLHVYPSWHFLPVWSFACLSFLFLSAYCFFHESGLILSFKNLPLVHLNAFLNFYSFDLSCIFSLLLCLSFMYLSVPSSYFLEPMALSDPPYLYLSLGGLPGSEGWPFNFTLTFDLVVVGSYT